MTESVVGAIAPAIEQAEIERAKRKPTESLDAYDHFLRGSASSYSLANQQACEEALRLFRKAIELDPNFASAHSFAAVSYTWAKTNGWISITPNDIAEVKKLAQRAVELEKDDVIALAASGYAQAFVARNLGGGAALIDRALALNSNSAEGWFWGGWVKNWLGEPEAAINRFARALRLNPLGPFVIGVRAESRMLIFSWAAMTKRYHGRRRRCRIIRIFSQRCVWMRQATQWLDGWHKRVRPWRGCGN